MYRSAIFRILLAVMLGMILWSQDLRAQRFAISTNLVEWATVSPNFSLDFSLSQHHAVSMSASVSPWKLTDKTYLSHITVSPEYKYWFNMPFYGHYLGANAVYSSYDLSLGSNARVGNLFAAGVTYGYSILLGKKWNIVPNIGLGAGVDLGAVAKFVPVVTRLGVTIQMVVR